MSYSSKIRKNIIDSPTVPSGPCSTCTGSCTGNCGNSCKISCSMSCVSTCSGTCAQSCRKTCETTCASACAFECDTSCAIGCRMGPGLQYFASQEQTTQFYNIFIMLQSWVVFVIEQPSTYLPTGRKDTMSLSMGVGLMMFD